MSYLDIRWAIVFEPLVVSMGTPIIEVVRKMEESSNAAVQEPGSGLKSTTELTASDCLIDNFYERPEHFGIASSVQSSCVVILYQDRLEGIATVFDLLHFLCVEHCGSPVINQSLVTSVPSIKYGDITDIYLLNLIFQQHQSQCLIVLNDQERPIGIITPETLRLFQLWSLQLSTTARAIDLTQRMLQAIHVRGSDISPPVENSFYSSTPVAHPYYSCLQAQRQIEDAEQYFRERQHHLAHLDWELSASLEALHNAEAELLLQDQLLEVTQSLREAERKRYQDLFNFAPDGYLVTNASHIIEAANYAARDMLCLEEAPLMYPSLISFVYKTDRQTFLQQIRKLPQTCETQYFEVHLCPKSGLPFQAAIAVTHILNDNRICTGFRWLIRDITTQKQAQNKLQQQNEMLQAIFDHIPVAIALYDAVGRIQFVNRQLQTVLGWSLAEIQQIDWLQSCYPDPDERQAVSAFLSASDGSWQDFRTRSRDGKLIDMMLASIQLSDGSRLGIGQDISERKRTEKALQESEELFRQMAENVNQVFWMIDCSTQKLIYVSPAYEKVWGRPCSSLYQDPHSIFESIHVEDQQLVAHAFTKACNTEIDATYRIVQPDGNICWIRDRAFPVQDSAGKTYRIVRVAEDVTEAKRSEQEMQSALQKERELNSLKSRFISVTSHEFRTPLAVIASSAGLLEDYIHDLDSQNRVKHLKRIQNKITHMTHLLEDILIINPNEMTFQDFKPQAVSVYDFCNNLIEEYEVGATHHTIIATIDPTINKSSILYADLKLLQQILTNLFSNAIKYSPKGKSIYFSVFYRANQIEFQIRDEGIGIPTEDIPRLFEPFHRANNVGTISGTGLGLTIVKKGVDLHGGTIQVFSTVGQGTTFTVDLPISLNAPPSGA